jgi:hypothetical protein
MSQCAPSTTVIMIKKTKPNTNRRAFKINRTKKKFLLMATPSPLFSTQRTIPCLTVDIGYYMQITGRPRRFRNFLTSFEMQSHLRQPQKKLDLLPH